MASYIDVVYNEKVRPYTGYPLQLCRYLFHRFDMKRGGALLDVGCGRGEFLKGFVDLGMEARGLDREKSNSQILKNIEVKHVNIESEPFGFESDMFDVVFAKSIIEHLFNPELFMRECYRVLKPGGRIIIMTPDWNSQMKIFFDDYTQQKPYTLNAIRDILNVFDFKEVNYQLFYQLPILWKYPALKILSRVLRLFVPVTTKLPIKFIRWSVELMILGTGVK